jgi:hypothetical protein
MTGNEGLLVQAFYQRPGDILQFGDNTAHRCDGPMGPGLYRRLWLRFDALPRLGLRLRFGQRFGGSFGLSHLGSGGNGFGGFEQLAQYVDFVAQWREIVGFNHVSDVYRSIGPNRVR